MDPRKHPSSPDFSTPVHLCSTWQHFQSHSKITPQISVEATLCLISLGKEQNPRASFCLIGCIIGNSKERGTQSLASFPVFFFFISRQNIMNMPYKFLGRDTDKWLRRWFHWFLKNHQCQHLVPPDHRHVPFSILNEMSPLVQSYNGPREWSVIRFVNNLHPFEANGWVGELHQTIATVLRDS